MAAQKITALTNLATPQPTMLMYAGLSPFGTTDDRKITANALFQEITANVSDVSIQFGNGAAATVSAASKGKIAYNATSQVFQVSENGGAYTNLLKGSGTSGQVGYFSATSTISGDTALVWDSTNDRLGIGVTVAASVAPLNVRADSGALAQQWFPNTVSDTPRARVQVTSSDARFGMSTTHPLYLITNSLERISIESGGAVAINRTSPAQAQLHVDAATNVTTGLLVNNASGSSVEIAIFQVNGSNRLRITQNGEVISGLASTQDGKLTLASAGAAFTQSLMAGTAPVATNSFRWPNANPTAGQSLTASAPSSGIVTLSWTTVTGASPGGVTNSVQINNGGGAFDGDAKFTYDIASSTVIIGSSAGVGKLKLRGTGVSNGVSLVVSNPASDFVYTLPDTAPALNQFLQATAVSGANVTLGWSTVSGTSPGGANTQIQFNNAGTFDGSANLTWVSPVLTVGAATSATGRLTLAHSGGSITTSFEATNAAASLVYQLPATSPIAGQFLQAAAPSGANVALSWATAVTGSGTATRVAFWSGTNALSSNAALFWDNTNARLGIGTATPGTSLDVVADGSAIAQQWRENGAGTCRVQLQIPSSFGQLGTTTNHAFAIITNGAQRLNVEATGGVVVGNVIAATATLLSNAIATGDIALIANNASGTTVDIARFQVNSSNRFRFLNTGEAIFGLASANTGKLTLSNASGTTLTSISAGNAASTLNFIWPVVDPTAGQILTASAPSGGNVTLSWTTGGGGGTSPGSPDTSIQFNNGGVFGGSANLTWVSPTLTIGVANSVQGALALASAGSSTTQTFTAGGAPSNSLTFRWPNSDPSNGQFLQAGAPSGGVVTMLWASALTGPAGSNTQIQYNNSGALGASAAFTWINGSNQLVIGQASVSTGLFTLANASGSTTTSFQAGNAASSLTYIWPTVSPTSGQVLSAGAPSGGNVTLSWANNTATLTATQIGYGDGSNALTGSTRLTWDNANRAMTLGELGNSGQTEITLRSTSTASAILTSSTAARSGSQGGVIFAHVGGDQTQGPGLTWSDGNYNGTSRLYLSLGLNWQGYDTGGQALRLRKSTATSSQGDVVFEFRPNDGYFQIAPFGASAGNTGEIHFQELAANGTNYVALRGPDSVGSTNPVIVLPSNAAPSANDVLTVIAVSTGIITTAWQAGGGGGISGSGTTGKLAKFTGATAVGDSIITESTSLITVAGRATLSGLTINTDATDTVASLTANATFTKNDANSRNFYGVLVRPTFNFGGSNASTTVNLLAVNSTNTSLTGGTFNLLNLAFGSVEKFNVDSNGAITFANGVRQAFAPSATTPSLNVGTISGDPSSPVNGDLWYDSTNNLLRAQINSATVSLGAGGGGSPGGSSGAVQYNNAGSFGGTNLTFASSALTQTRTGLGTTLTETLIQTNTTAAAAGAQQVSPAYVWEGQGWKTNATAASQSVKFAAYVLPVQGTANPTGTWTLASNINNAGYVSRMTLTSTGVWTVTGANDTFQMQLNTGQGQAYLGTANSAALTFSTNNQGGALTITTGRNITMASGSLFGFGSASSTATNDPDTAFSRAAAAVWRVNGTSTTTPATFATPALTPAQITADQNNYNPGTGWFQRWSSDASRNVTGLVAGVDGQVAEIWNVGTQDIVIVHQSASSLAANRFINASAANYTVTPGQGVKVTYDAGSSRWRVYQFN